MPDCGRTVVINCNKFPIGHKFLCRSYRLSGNEFFSRLPGLHSFLTESLEKIIANLDLGKNIDSCALAYCESAILRELR